MHLVELVTLNAESEAVGSKVWAGIRLAEWFGRETKRIYSAFQVPGGADEGLMELRDLEVVIKANGGSITPRKLRRRRSRYRSCEEAEKALNRLKKKRGGEWRLVKTRRRPPRVSAAGFQGLASRLNDVFP